MSIARQVGFAAPVAVWLLVAGARPGVAHAQAEKGPSKADRAAARDAYDKGTASFERGNYVDALDSFVKANALIPSVQAMYWIAQAQDKLGRTDAAIEAYEAITSRADFAKLSEDKVTTVRERLAALKASKEPPPAPPAPVVVPPPAPVEPPPVTPMPTTPVEPPPAPQRDEALPERNTAELGVMGGALFVTNAHNLVGAGQTHRNFEVPVWQVGIRAAFFPEKVFGVEAEWAHGFGNEVNVTGSAGSTANLDIVRGHLIGQLPTSRLVPFALLGAGMWHGSSDHNGTDTDFLLEAGAGLKVMATKLLVPRLDLRLNVAQKRGGGMTEGLSVHPEVLLGLSFTLGR